MAILPIGALSVFAWELTIFCDPKNNIRLANNESIERCIVASVDEIIGRNKIEL
jgi:hypothetical protein